MAIKFSSARGNSWGNGWSRSGKTTNPIVLRAMLIGLATAFFTIAGICFAFKYEPYKCVETTVISSNAASNSVNVSYTTGTKTVNNWEDVLPATGDKVYVWLAQDGQKTEAFIDKPDVVNPFAILGWIFFSLGALCLFAAASLIVNGIVKRKKGIVSPTNLTMGA
jgi:hypothetical protein